MIFVETPRLVLRAWKPSDCEPFSEMNRDAEVMRYFPNTLTSDESDCFYEEIQKEMNEYGYGLYAVEMKGNKEFIGFLGFHRATFDADFTPCVEIGWRLKKEAWGKGYATEGAKVCLEYGFSELGFEEIYSFTAVINKPSERVMIKAGMSFKQYFYHSRLKKDDTLSKHVLYKITKPKMY